MGWVVNANPARFTSEETRYLLYRMLRDPRVGLDGFE
jgi:rRNA maturation protein Nop10